MTDPNQQPSFAQELSQAGAQAEGEAQQGGTKDVTQQPGGEEVLTLDDVTAEDTLDVKSTSNFYLRFLRSNEKRKFLKGSKDALEFLQTVEFLETPAEAEAEEVDEDAPKKRGRKPKKAQAEPKQQVLRIAFYDDQKNNAINFLDYLATREDFLVELVVVNDKDEDIEVFAFEGANVLPQTTRHRFTRNEGEDVRVRHLNLSYETLTRTSISDGESDE